MYRLSVHLTAVAGALSLGSGLRCGDPWDMGREEEQIKAWLPGAQRQPEFRRPRPYDDMAAHGGQLTIKHSRRGRGRA